MYPVAILTADFSIQRLLGLAYFQAHATRHGSANWLCRTCLVNEPGDLGQRQLVAWLSALLCDGFRRRGFELPRPQFLKQPGAAEFAIADAAVLAAVLHALWESRRQPITFAAFTLVGHFYAYNTVAKIAASGLEQPLLWFAIDPVIVALLAWKGLQPQPTQAPEREHEDPV